MFLCNTIRIAHQAFPERSALSGGTNLHRQTTANVGTNVLAVVGIHTSSPSSRTLRDAFSRSRLIVCTYPQTTFSEAMHSGIPTVLLYPETLWQLDNAFGDLVRELRKTRVVFSDPIEAADHVNEIWKDADEWWARADTTRVREMFFDLCGRVRSDWLNEWVGFFQNESRVDQ